MPSGLGYEMKYIFIYGIKSLNLPKIYYSISPNVVHWIRHLKRPISGVRSEQITPLVSHVPHDPISRVHQLRPLPGLEHNAWPSFIHSPNIFIFNTFIQLIEM